MTWGDLLKEGEALLRSMEDAVDASSDAWWLLNSVCGWERSAFLLHETEDAPENAVLRYREQIRLRRTGMPCAYILGEWDFMGLTLKVNENVLIPRQDTETLAEEAFQYACRDIRNNGKKSYRILDICTGSGCLALSLSVFLKREFPFLRLEMIASDLSAEALRTAKENADLYSVPVTFLQSDLLTDIPKQKFDMVVCNPPYIDAKQMLTLDRDVREFEPYMALAGGEDGLDFYRRLSVQCGPYLSDGGHVFWEIGDEQNNSVKDILEADGSSLKYDRCIRDLCGKDRVIEAERKQDV